MKKQIHLLKCLRLLGCAVLIAAMALSLLGCGEEKTPEGSVSFQVVVTDLEGTETTFDLTSDKKTVGEALQEEGILEGEEGPYGLYIKAVNGISLDWDRDQKYWAFYVDGEYAITGADMTDLTEGAVYSFKPES